MSAEYAEDMESMSSVYLSDHDRSQMDRLTGVCVCVCASLMVGTHFCSLEISCSRKKYRNLPQQNGLGADAWCMCTVQDSAASKRVVFA